MKVIKPFLYREKPLQAGEDFPGSPEEAAKFVALGFLEQYETKAPAKPGKSSSAAPAAQASKKKTSTKRTKKPKK